MIRDLLAGAVLTLGIAAIKIGIFVVLPIWLMLVVGRKLFCWIFKRGNGGDGNDAGSSSRSEPPPPPPATASATADEFDVG